MDFPVARPLENLRKYLVGMPQDINQPSHPRPDIFRVFKLTVFICVTLATYARAQQTRHLPALKRGLTKRAGIPAQAGIQGHKNQRLPHMILDSRRRGNDGL
jgi:hypothetical protein